MSDTTSRKARRTYFIDSENHINTCLQGIDALSEDDLVLVFHRESNLSQKQKNAIRDSRARIEWILCQDSGVKNSLDVQLIAELSRRIACQEIENGYIISQDQGYRPAIHYLLNRYAEDFRFIGLKRSIDEFLLTDALISAESRQEVHAALVHAAGQIIGTAMYRHVRDVFDESSASDEPEGGFMVDGAPSVTDPALVSEDEGAYEHAGQAGGSEAEAPSGGPRRSNKRRKARTAPKQTMSTPASSHKDNRVQPHDDDDALSPLQVSEPETTLLGEASSVRPGQNSSASARRRGKVARNVEQVATHEPSHHEEATPTKVTPVKAKPAAPSKAESKSDKQQNLTSLTNIGLALAKRLEACDITTPDALRAIGSREAWRLLKEQSGSASISWLYALEGAIRDITVKDLNEQDRLELQALCRQRS